MLLSHRVAIITGGSRGIGKGIALKFAEEGCSVIIVATSAEGQKTAEEISKKGYNGFFIKCDVSNSLEVQNMVSQVINKYNKIDILVNNAGIGSFPKPIAEVSEEEWDRTLDVNLKGVFLCCKTIAPHMIKKRYGKIINISSVAAISPLSPVSYTASKGGMLTFTVDLAVELARFNICVNAILPGIIRTDMVDSFVTDGENKEDYYDKLVKTLVPMGRAGTPNDIAGTALFLASDLSDYVTADMIIVGGGSPWKSIFSHSSRIK